MVYLWYLDVYCHNATRLTPKQRGPTAGSGIRSSGVSTQGACASHASGRDEDLGSFKYGFEYGFGSFGFTKFLFVSSCFICVCILSRRVWMKEFLRFQSTDDLCMYFFILSPKLQKSQEFLARRLFLCSKQQIFRIFAAERFLEGEKKWDRIGHLRNEGLRARHPSDSAAIHL